MTKSKIFGLMALMLVTACMPAPSAQVSKRLPSDGVLQPADSDGFPSISYLSPAPSRSNSSIAQDFLRLTFSMESGRSLPVLTRFEGPIRVKLTGRVPPTARDDLARLLSRLRNEAGIDIAEVDALAEASITVEFRPHRELAAAVRSAACFVVPEVDSFAAYRQNRSSVHGIWSTLSQRTKVAVFAPSDSSPQEVRDCLHEELAQALGPVNDLYHLTDSVFNDDNFNTRLTRFDMLVLRAYYAPDLQSGMNEAQVARLLPGILQRINPQGGKAGAAGGSVATNRNWTLAVEASFGGSGSISSRTKAAERMVSIALAQGWSDGRLGFSHYAMGRALLSQDPAKAVKHLTLAAQIYSRQPGSEQHSAHVDMQLAAVALASGQNAQAIAFADRALVAAQSGENAALTTSLMMIKAEALAESGQGAAAQALRLDSENWARYGFGSETRIRSHAAEIARLANRG